MQIDLTNHHHRRRHCLTSSWLLTIRIIEYALKVSAQVLVGEIQRKTITSVGTVAFLAGGDSSFLVGCKTHALVSRLGRCRPLAKNMAGPFRRREIMLQVVRCSLFGNRRSTGATATVSAGARTRGLAGGTVGLHRGWRIRRVAFFRDTGCVKEILARDRFITHWNSSFYRLSGLGNQFLLC